MSSILKPAAPPVAGTASAVFADISGVAERERLRLFGPPQEPAEIQLARMQAIEEARQTISEALLHADRIREDARADGYAKGYECGYADGASAGRVVMEAEAAEMRAQLQAICDAVLIERGSFWASVEPQVVEFVLELARKVVKTDAEVNRRFVVSVARNALRRVSESLRIVIRVSHLDLETLRASREELLTLVDGIERLEIIEDRRVSPGGCVVETASGVIDARIDTQFAAIAAALREVALESCEEPESPGTLREAA